MKNKIITIIISLIFILILPSQDVSGSILNQEISSDGTVIYHVFTRDDNFLAFSVIKSHMETKAKIIYYGEMIELSNNYLQEGLKYNFMPQNKVFNTSYGIGSYYSYSISQNNNENGTISANYNILYLENKDQTEYVQTIIRNAVKENVLNLKTDYQKAYWAYNWVLDNIHYDETNSKHSAYDGLQQTGTVCNGYATLYCALANELGLDCAFVSGTVGLDNKINHAWNIIKLDGKWYCVDTTWGDNDKKDKYFLIAKETLCSADYKYHNSDLYDYYIREGEVFATTNYDNMDLSESHPLMPSVYNIEMDILKYNTLKIGEGYTFMINNKDNVTIDFESENTQIATVDEKGIITGLSEGTTTVTAYNTDLNIAQKCIITVISNYNHPVISVDNLSLKIGSNFDINIKNKISGSKYKWTSSNYSIVKVKASNGVVTAVGKGSAVIICTITQGTAVYELKIKVKVT